MVFIGALIVSMAWTGCIVRSRSEFIVAASSQRQRFLPLYLIQGDHSPKGIVQFRRSEWVVSHQEITGFDLNRRQIAESLIEEGEVTTSRPHRQ
jgi:hypothetical protein